MKNLEEEPQAEYLGRPDPLLTPEQWERQKQAAALVLEWAKEEDDGLWPLVEEEFGLKK